MIYKIAGGILVAFAIIISCGVGAMCGAIAGAILLPVKVFNMWSDDSTGKASDKI
jgi:Na+/melibiose symporter-like transporter